MQGDFGKIDNPGLPPAGSAAEALEHGFPSGAATAPRQPGGAVDLISLIGNTPLLRLGRIAREYPGVEIYAKAEWVNPGGSVKDRPALNIIREAERSGRLCHAKTLIDSTSGNTGIAYAMIAAARGYRIKLFMPGNVSVERKRILQAYGAEVVYTDPLDGSDGAIRAVRALARENFGQYFYANQYDNPANWQAHYQTTASEIWQQTAGRITHFVCGLGTGGTFTGTSRRLKELKPEIRCISAQPDAAFHGLEGLKHMPTNLVPAIYDPTLADENMEVRTEDGQQIARRLAREEGILVGVSAGAALWACLDVARRLPKHEHALIVTVFPDSGEKYLTDRFWSEEWARCRR